MIPRAEKRTQLPRRTRRAGPLQLLSAAVALFALNVVSNSPSVATAAAPEDLAVQAPSQQSAASLAPAPAPSPVPGIAPAIFPTLPGSFRTAASNAAVDWNIAAQWVVRNGNATNIASRVFAVFSLGIWQALEANERSADQANSTAVAGYAAHNMLANMFPNYFSQYDALLTRQLEGLPASEREKAKNIAYPVVVKLQASRLADGFQDPQPPPAQNATPGEFQDVGTGTFRAIQQFATTEPLLLPPDLGSLGFVANFTPPPVYPSNAYSTELTATLLLGSNTSTVRTLDQSQTALFWSDGGTGTTGIPGHWNQLVLATMPDNITLLDSAKILAKVNVAMYDTTIVIFYLKYVYNRWRPVTAIRLSRSYNLATVLNNRAQSMRTEEGVSDMTFEMHVSGRGDMDHTPVTGWTPLLMTPNNPTYPSAQGGYGGASEILLSEFYGRDAYTFSLGTEVQRPGYYIQSRTYRSFSFASAEVSQSRYFGGIENPADAKAGRMVGQYVGEYTSENFEAVLSPV